MAAKTARMIPTFFVVAVLALIAAAVAPSVKKMLRERDGVVVVTVDFSPTIRTGVAAAGRQFPDYVVVALTVAGHPVQPNMNVTASPWVWTLYPKKGQLVVVQASQVYGARLGCTITQPKTSPSSQSKIGPSEVTCKHTTA